LIYPDVQQPVQQAQYYAQAPQAQYYPQQPVYRPVQPVYQHLPVNTTLATEPSIVDETNSSIIDVADDGEQDLFVKKLAA